MTDVQVNVQVKLTIVGGEAVEAQPNPLTVKARELASVSWKLPPTGLVVLRFRSFEPAGDSVTPAGDPRRGPFESLAQEESRLVGRGSNGRTGFFLYDVFLLDPDDPRAVAKKLEWVNPVRMPDRNGGGIEVEGPPP